MATIKSYSDLQQSKELAEILPLESADMEYLAIKENGLLVAKVPFVKDDSEVENSAFSQIYNRIPCWSLAALLDVLRGTNISIPDTLDKVRYSFWNDYDITYASNPVDACYEMILKLHELKLL